MMYQDLFTLYRWMLFVFLSVYALLRLIGMFLRFRALLRGDDPGKRLLRTYLAYQVLSVRWRRYAGELGQIAMWAVALLGIWWLHSSISEA